MALNYDSLLKQFDLYKQIIERMPVHIYWKDNQFRYLACNELQARNVGLSSPTEIVGKTDYELYSEKTSSSH
ncbi:hypothetical protein [Legionella sp.]|uniref:hypothetical protein n=1 Tax=Legionella sp. TaxID=459 RepID=UPI00321F9E73